jgi:hypothetical protein
MGDRDRDGPPYGKWPMGSPPLDPRCSDRAPTADFLTSYDQEMGTLTGLIGGRLHAGCSTSIRTANRSGRAQRYEATWSGRGGCGITAIDISCAVQLTSVARHPIPGAPTIRDWAATRGEALQNADLWLGGALVRSAAL